MKIGKLKFGKAASQTTHMWMEIESSSGGGGFLILKKLQVRKLISELRKIESKLKEEGG